MRSVLSRVVRTNKWKFQNMTLAWCVRMKYHVIIHCIFAAPKKILPPQENSSPFSRVWPSWPLKKIKSVRVWIVDETDDFESFEHPSIGIAESPLHTSTIVVVFGRAPVMSNAGGASCIQHHCMHPLITEAMVSWLSNCSIVLDYRGASCTPILRLHAAVPKRELGSALVLEHEFSDSSEKFLKFQGDKLKIRGWQSERRKILTALRCFATLYYGNSREDGKKSCLIWARQIVFVPPRTKNDISRGIMSCCS